MKIFGLIVLVVIVAIILIVLNIDARKPITEPRPVGSPVYIPPEETPPPEEPPTEEPSQVEEPAIDVLSATEVRFRIKDRAGRNKFIILDYKGAFNDTPSDRALNMFIGEFTETQPAIEKAYNLGAKYIGFQYYRADRGGKFQVWIDPYRDSYYDVHGEATALYKVGSIHIGGGNVNAVYKVKEPMPIPNSGFAAKILSKEVTFMGVYKDVASPEKIVEGERINRVFKETFGRVVGPDGVMNALIQAKDRGYEYFAIQAYRIEGTVEIRVGKADVQYNKYGVSPNAVNVRGVIYGGDWANAVYKIN